MEIYCLQLGMLVEFSYCTSMNDKLPCRNILGCWKHRADIITILREQFTDEELKQIELPTLLLIGAGEKIYNPKKAINRAHQLMPDLTAEIIPNVGHTLIMEQPENVNARILEFLSR